MNKIKNNKVIKCLFASITILAICSKSSLLYSINNWGDVSCYFIIGRGILHGLVPFRDLVDNKGPVIFFVYAIGEIISEYSFIGIYIIECICATIFLFYSLKVVALFYEINGLENAIIFSLSAAIYASFIMRLGGGPEELSLCCMAYSLYLCTKYLEKNNLPSKKEMFLLGIFAGILFWTKYTLCAVYISILLFMLWESICEKEIRQYLLRIVHFILGCLTISLPIVLYFMANDSLNQLFEWYFYNNIFLYRTNEAYNISVFNSLIKAIKILLKARNVLADILLISGIIWMIINKKIKLLMMYVSTFLLSFVIFNMGVPQIYSCLPLMHFCVFGILVFVGFINRRNIILKKWQEYLYIIICLCTAYVFCIHTYDLCKPREFYPQYVFADEMKSYGNVNYRMLYYGKLDPGFYFATGILPNWRAYVQSNMGGDELLNEQNRYINEKEPDFIITTDKILCDTLDYDKEIERWQKNHDLYTLDIKSFDDFSYVLVDEMEYFLEEYNHIARLYKKR